MNLYVWGGVYAGATWIGKEKVVGHHQDVPFRVLEKQYTYGADESENMIIHGDNLEALNALLSIASSSAAGTKGLRRLRQLLYIQAPTKDAGECWNNLYLRRHAPTPPRG